MRPATVIAVGILLFVILFAAALQLFVLAL
jgi:hypothetical protein